MKQLNLVMIVKNEENNIARCLESVKGIVNNIIIVDTGSTDKTKEICLSCGADVYDYEWNDDFSAARNYGLSKSNADWNLILDADEYIVDIDKKSLSKFINSNKKRVGLVKMVNLFEQDNEIRQAIDRISRLIPKGVMYDGSVHEQIVTTYPKVNIDLCVEHDGYLYQNKFDRNIKLLINEFEKNPNDPYLNYQIAKTYHNNEMFEDSSIYLSKYYDLKDFSTDAFYNSAIILYINNCIKTKDFDLGIDIILDNFELLQNESEFHFTCGIFFMEAILSDIDKYGEYYENIEICYLNALQVGDSDTGVKGSGSYYAAYNLGVYYEMNKNIEKAKECYALSANYEYEPAIKRLGMLSK